MKGLIRGFWGNGGEKRRRNECSSVGRGGPWILSCCELSGWVGYSQTLSIDALGEGCADENGEPRSLGWGGRKGVKLETSGGSDVFIDIRNGARRGGGPEEASFYKRNQKS